MTDKKMMRAMVPVMVCFFAMGFVDLVGIASNYVKADMHLSDSQANIFPSLVFLWFLVFSGPTGVLMNRIGRKNTVMLSLLVTIVSLFIPLTGEGIVTMAVSFCLLGIGNAIMQTSLNPLVSSFVTGRYLASTLTFGQFIKAIASFLAPYIAMWGATASVPLLGWRVLFAIYFIVGLLAALLLGFTRVEESPADSTADEGGGKGLFGQYVECFRLLSRSVVVLCFIAILCHVGIDVGANVTAPKILMERLGIPLNSAAFATSLYFIFRTLGCFTGAVLLRRMDHKLFFLISAGLMALSMAGLMLGSSPAVLYASIAAVGLGNSNIFSLVMSRALLAVPDRQNAVSGLMIMGLFGGTIFPLIMGFMSDMMGQAGAVAVMAAGTLYLIIYGVTIKTK